MATTRRSTSSSRNNGGGGSLARFLLPAAALGIGAYLLWPRAMPGTAPGPPNTLPPPPRPSGGGGGFVPSRRDRLADEGRALLNAAQNPATVTAAQLRAKAVELRRVQEPELAKMLEDAADRHPIQTSGTAGYPPYPQTGAAFPPGYTPPISDGIMPSPPDVFCGALLTLPIIVNVTKNGVVTSAEFQERAAAARRMNMPAAIISALENQARTSPQSANDLRTGQIVRIDMTRGDMYPAPGQAFPMLGSRPRYLDVRVLYPNGCVAGESYSSETVVDPALIAAIRGTEAQVTSLTQQLQAVQPYGQLYSEPLRQQLQNAQAALQQLRIRAFPPDGREFKEAIRD